MRMHWELVVRFLICFCLMGFSEAATSCQPERCGSTNVSYPFWIHKFDCGYPGFQIVCKEDNSTGEFAPFLPAYVELNATHVTGADFPIMEINYTGDLIINSTSLKAQSCNFSAHTRKYFGVDAPFTISTSNRFVVIGCGTSGTYSYGDSGEVSCKPDCANFCGTAYCDYGCCETVLADNWQLINFTGEGWFYYKNKEKCGFSTVFDPSTFKVVDENTDMFYGEGRKASYGLRVNWSIGQQNCSLAKSTANYSCSSYAECINFPTGEGHVCKCLTGYEGTGYSNGTSCTDVDECSHRELNQCIEPLKGGICHNFPGSYNCSCTKGYKGDGFQCESSTSFKNSLIPATIGSISSFIVVSLGASGLFWWLRSRRLNNLRDKYFLQNGGLQLLN